MSYSILRRVCITLLVFAAVASLSPVTAWAAGPNNFHTLTPCRVYDTRNADAPALQADVERKPIQITGVCGVPSDAKAVSLNVTVVDGTGSGEMFVYPGDAPTPAVGGFMFPANKIKARLEIVELASDVSGTLAALADMAPGQSVHLIMDVDGYFMDSAGPVNDPVTVNEDSGANTLDVRGNDNGPPGGGPFIIDSVTQPANGTVVITNSGADLTYEPALNYCNNPPGTTTDNFTYGVTPGHSTPSDSTATVAVTVNCVNDAPAGTDGAVSTGEDTDYVFAAADFGFTDPLDSTANALLAVKITTLPALGSLTLSGGAVSAGQSIAVADITGGNLKFTPVANGNGSPYTSFTFQVQDDGGTANGGVDLDPSANTLTINVTGVNNPPAGTDGAVSTPEDTQYTFTAADFGFTDPLDTPANNLASVVITTLPGLGSLTLSGSGFAAGTEIAVADITAGNLKYGPVANAFGSPYTTFTFQVRDDGGTAGGGVDLDASANTLTINVTAANDAPAGADNTVSTSEDVQYTFAAADFGFSDPIDSPANALQAVKITTLPAAGTLTLSGSGFLAGTDIAVADITAGNLKFTPAANASGSPYTTFTFQVRDDGGTAGGGVDLDPSANTMTVNVTAVNDAPAGTNNTVATLEEAQYTFTAADFGFTDPNDSPANALASVVITTLPGAGSLTLSGGGFAAGTEIVVADITAGNLKFTPAANGSGSPYATFTFQVRDDGGTANGGIDLDASPNTMSVNVTGINDEPAGTNNSVAAVEDAQYTFTAADFGFTDPNDSPANALASVVITTLPGTGTLTLSGSGFAAGTEISAANITAGNLKFTPAANGSGSPYTTFTFQVRDDGGTANGGVDLDASANTLTVNVTAVNDAPAGTNNSVAALEDAQYTFTAADFGFTDPNDSPANALASVVITTLPGAGTLTLSGSGFAAGTEISLANITAGNLKFTPAANGSGSPYTTFTFQVRDDGGTANGGVDLDPSANTITVNVTAVNDAPAGTNNSVATLEETQYTFAAADFGFTDPNDSPANALASVVITTLPGTGTLTLSGGGFAAGTEISLANITAGNLKFTPAANGSGSPYTTFTFQVRDDGGTANGGVDLDASANTMTVNVTAVNDAPAGTNNTVAAVEDAQYTFTAADFGFTDPNDSPANALASVVITTLPGAGTLTLSGGGFAAGTEISLANITGGNLKFTPAANGSGSPYTTFTFQVRDDGGTANGGVDLDPSANTMTVNVTAVNDAPAGTNNTVTTDEDVAYTFTAADFGFTDPNDSPANALASVVITTLPGAGSLTLSGGGFVAGTEISLANITAGNLKFLGAANAFGSPYASFTFQVRDNGGTASGGVDLDPTPNTMTINVTPVNDAPTVVSESFDVLGNTELRIDLAPGTTPHTSETTVGASSYKGVLDNDGDVEGDVVTVTAVGNGCADISAPFDCTLSDGAVVHLEANGELSYTPGPGDTSGSFTYTVTDQPGFGAPLSVNGTVTFNHSTMVWWVDPAAGGGGNGTSVLPFNTLDTLDDAGGGTDPDVANDYIFVHDGSLTLSAAMEMEANQHLIGEGAGLSIPVNLNGNGSPTVLLAAGARPQLTFAGDTVKVGTAIPIEIIGLSLASTSGNAIDLTSAAALSGSATLTIDGNEIRGATAEGVDINLNAGTNGTLAVNFTNNTWDLTGTHTGNSFDARTASATANLRVNFSNNTNVLSTGAGASGVFLDGSGGGTLTVTGFANNSVHQNTVGNGILAASVTFDSNTGTAGFQQVSGGTTVIGTPGNGVGGSGMSLTSVQGNLFYSDLDIFADGGAGLRVSGTGGGMTFGTSAGVAIVEATGGPAVDVSTVALTLPLSSLKSTNSTTTGVALNSITGSFSAGAGSTISNITSAAGTAFQVGSSNATISYAGTITNTNGKGVDLTSNTGSTIGFTGTLTLTSGTNTAFNATGGGTVTTTDTASTLTTTTGTALNVANTTIGAGGLTFRSIASNGGGAGSTGIVLNATGSSGGLTVSGTGAAGSGGTIQNKATGISLTNTRGPSFNWMQLNDFSDFAIRGNDVTNFTLNRSVVSGANGDSVPSREGSVIFNNLFGTATVSHSTISGAVEDNLRVENTSGTLTSFTLSGTGGTGSSCQILNNSTTTGNIGFRFAAFNSANMTASVSNCLFRGNRTDSINIDAANTSTVTSTVNNNYILAGTGGNNQGNLGINVTSGATGLHTTTVSGNFVGTDGVTPASLLNTGINLFSGNGSTLVATVTSNTVRNAGVGSGHGIQVFQDLTSNLRVNVDGNTVSNVALDFGIRVEAAGDPAAVTPAGSLHAGVTNNNVSVLSTALDAIRVRSRRTTTLCADIRSNTTNAGGSGFFGLFTNQANTSTFNVEGLALGSQTAATTQTYLIGQNPAAATVSVTAVTNYNGVAANSCSIP